MERLEWLRNNNELERDKLLPNPYNSVDPAPPAAAVDIAGLTETLLNEEKPLFQRYRAMFTLRNIGSKEAVLALAEGKLKMKVILSCKLISVRFNK